MHGLPFWLDIERPRLPRLEANTAAYAVVVGAGIAGLKLARSLAQRGIDTVVLEAGRAGDGASSRNQGVIHHGGGESYIDMAARHGRETACSLWELGLEGHRRVRDLIAEYDIECDYQREGYRHLVRSDLPGAQDRLDDQRKEWELLQEDGFDVKLLDETAARRVVDCELLVGGIEYAADAQFHSGKFVVGLARGVSRLNGVRVFEDSPVLDVRRRGDTVTAITPRATVEASTIFLATNATAPQCVPQLERALRAERGQVFVTEPLAERPCRGAAGARLAWWREIIEPDGRFRLLFGGGRDRDEPDSLFPQFTSRGKPHPTIASEGFRPSDAHQRRLDEQFAKFFPRLVGVRITHRWGGLQSFTADSLPVVGEFDVTRRIHGVAGFCGLGNTYSDAAAEYLAGKIAGVESDIGSRFGHVLERLMRVGRKEAEWDEWKSDHVVP